jgi:hypothetical protein
VQVRGQDQGAALIGGIHEPIERLGLVRRGRQQLSSTTISSERTIRSTTLPVVASIRERAMVAVRASRVIPDDSEVAIDRGVGDRLEPARKVPVIGVRLIRTSIRLFYVWAPDFLDSLAARAARPAVVGDDRDVYHRPVPMWRRDTPGHGRALRAE